MKAKSNVHDRFYEFGDFRIDVVRRTLRRRDELVVLPPRVFDTLVVLLANAGEVVTKGEMLDAVWGETFVEESNLTQNIYTIRRLLGKTPDGKDWIETVPRRGYVFSGSATVVGDNDLKTNPDVSVEEPLRASVRVLTPVNLVVAAAILLTATALGYFLYVSYRTVDPDDISGRLDLKKLSFSGDLEFPTISPDGNRFAFAREGKLFIQDLNRDDAAVVPLPENVQAGFLQFTPDSKAVAFRDQRRFFLTGSVLRYDLGTRETTKLAGNVWSGFGFSHDGARMAFVRDLPDENRHQLIVSELESGTEKVLAELSSPSRFILISAPDFSPDNKRIAVAVSRQDALSPRSQLSVYDIESGKVEEYAPQNIKQFEQAIWRPDGSSLNVIARENQKFFQIWELSYPVGKMLHVTNDLNIYRGLSMTADGSTLISVNQTLFSHIWTAPSDDLNALKQVTFGNLNRDGTIGIAWLPDSSVVYSSRVFGNVDMWRAGPAELERLQLTREAGDVNSFPELARDGHTLYFTSNRTGLTQVWKMEAKTGDGQTQLTFGEKESNEFPQISASGESLYFVKKAKGHATIFRRSLGDGSEVPLPLEGQLTPESFLALSPDGKLIATCSLGEKVDDPDAAREYKIAVLSTEHSEAPRIFTLPSNWIAWSPDGAAFDYVEITAMGSKVWRQQLNGSPKIPLFELKGERIAKLQWSPDGKTLALSRGKRLTDAVLITLN